MKDLQTREKLGTSRAVKLFAELDLRALLGGLKRRLADEGGALWFVGLIWLVMSYLLCDFIRASAVDIPFMDEWEMIPALAGQQKMTFAWLWSQHNEHRIVLPRLLYLAVMAVGRNSFESGMFFDALVLSASAAALLLSARKLRGKSVPADAFFPLILLHLAQVENLLWGFQIVFVCGAATGLVALIAIARTGKPTLAASVVVGLCALSLPLFSGQGLALAPPLALATLTMAWQLRGREGTLRHAHLAVGSLGLASLALTAFYFVGYERPPGHPVSPSLEKTQEAVVQLLSLGFGSGAPGLWSTSAHVATGLTLATGLLLLVRFVRGGEDRLRVLRLGLFFGGMLVLVGGIAWARAGLYSQGLVASRYTTLVSPLFCGAFLIWEWPRHPQLTRFAQSVLFLFAAMMVVRNFQAGVGDATYVQGSRGAARNEILNEVPLSQVAARYCHILYKCGTPVLLERMLLLREKKIGDFEYANPN